MRVVVEVEGLRKWERMGALYTKSLKLQSEWARRCVQTRELKSVKLTTLYSPTRITIRAGHIGTCWRVDGERHRDCPSIRRNIWLVLVCSMRLLLYEGTKMKPSGIRRIDWYVEIDAQQRRQRKAIGPASGSHSTPRSLIPTSGVEPIHHLSGCCCSSTLTGRHHCRT